MTEHERAPIDARVGLCSVCRHARVQRSANDSTFWRCLRARTDPAYLPYPPLPVRTCPGHEPHQSA